VLLIVAILYAAATVVYSASWFYYIRAERSAQLGVDLQRSELRQETLVTEVIADSPAQRAGFEIGDNILAINHRPLTTMNPLYDSLSRGRPGDLVTFTVRRPGVPAPISLSAILAPAVPPAPLAPTKRLALEVLFSYQAPFVLVGLSVLFLRLENREAWLLALMFGGFIAGSPVLIGEPLIRPELRGFAFAYMVASRGMFPAVFYYFFATFPVSSPIDRRLPRLKSLVPVAAAMIVVPLSLWTLIDGGSRPLALAKERLPWRFLAPILVLYFMGVTGLGLVSLIANNVSATGGEARRKIRVIVWGMLCGLIPFLVMQLISIYTRTEYWNFPFWIWVPAALLLCLVPLAFAYAVVKHRVLEIPVLLKRSVRYVLVQRGFIVLLFSMAAVTVALFTRIFSHFIEPGSNLGMAISAVFGVVLVWASAPVVKRGTQRIDRAFFRSAYDAREILENLVEQTRAVASLERLATLLAEQIGHALHPTWMAVYLGDRDGGLQLHDASGPMNPQSLSPELPLLAQLARERKPWEASAADHGERIASDALSMFTPRQTECLVPMFNRGGNLTGLLVLGPRLSEESYSREDTRLLALVASQAGIALETMRLAEEMAERIQAEKRAAQELAIAAEVQARLFPQKFPPLATLEYSGRCIQARQVGGDYYDFLNLGSGRLGIVQADIAGKGISGALLMASLQASLRGQYAVALEDLPQLLKSVNQLFYENTGDSTYATMFFGDYQDVTRRLRYANCGHNPPILLRSSGSIERLASTATVLGLFEDWECRTCDVEFAAGDILVIYTDGITEATGEGGEEFGEGQLVDVIRNKSCSPVPFILDAVLSAVQQFSGSEQADDLTLVVARAR
jgi:sigma-B regulation protein RsbU (phosphoserine phosphatase)